MRPIQAGCPRGRRSRGFSLAEALVSVAILALIGSIVFGTVSRGLDARERATGITERYAELRQALGRMSQEIGQAYLSMHKDYRDPRSATLFATKRAGGGQRLDFTSFSHTKFMADAKECDQNELSYFLEVDPQDSQRKHLMRREAVRVDEHPDEGGRVQVLAHDITELKFAFYDPKGDRWEESWDSTSQDHRNRLPKYVKMMVSARDDEGRIVHLSTKTRLMMQAAILIPGSGFSPGID
jgi:general secretion pathway protein J